MSRGDESGSLSITSYISPGVLEYASVEELHSDKMPLTTAQIIEARKWRDRYSVKHKEELERPHSVERIRVPLPKDVISASTFRFEFKNKATGEIGFQLISAGSTRAKRTQFLNREFPEASNMRVSPLALVDRAMFPGEERSHTRCYYPIPNRKDRAKTTLVDVIANILSKQYQWMKTLSTTDYVHLWDTQHRVWQEWRKNATTAQVWVIAIRKTLPDNFGNSHYIPELELRFK